MDKAKTKHIGRRSLLKGSAAITATAALATVPAIAGTRDPILDMIAEAQRLHAIAQAATDRAEAARKSVGDDCCGRPLLDTSKPEFRTMLPWLERWKGHPYHEGEGISRSDIEHFNAHLEETITHERYAFIGRAAMQAVQADTIEDGANILTEAAERLRQMGPDLTEEEERTLAQYRRDGEARLAWWDETQAQRERNAEVSGYRSLSEEADERWDECGDLEVAILEAYPVTIEGALAQLAIVANDIKKDIADAGEEGIDVYRLGIVRAYDALVRLSSQNGAA
jgi:hypothetical protein